MSEFNPRVSPEATDGLELQNDSPESELPSQDRLFDDFADRRRAYADELASAESVPGFKRTFADTQNIRDVQAKVDAFNQEWQRYGGTEVDVAQAAVDALNFRSTFEDQAQAKRGLSDARDVFYENFRQEFEAQHVEPHDPAEDSTVRFNHARESGHYREQLPVGGEYRLALTPESSASIYLGSVERAAASENDIDNPSRIQIIDLSEMPRNNDGDIMYEGHRMDPELKYLLVQGNIDWNRDSGKSHFKGLRAGETVALGRGDGVTDRRFDLPETVSREHCTISIDEDTGELVITDKESANGTTLEMTVAETEVGTPSDADREAAEAAAASANNPQNQHEAMPPEEIARAHELLSNSAQLRTEIKDVAAEVVSAAQRGRAHALNGLSTPKNKYLEWRRDAAQEKYDRKAARQGTSMFKFVNKHYDKVAAKAQSKLKAKQSAYEGHSRMMDGRVANAEQRTLERRELGDKLRNKLMEDKIKAEERKLIRKEKAERHRQAKRSEQRLSYTERQAFVDTFTPQQKQQIRNAAIRAIKNRNR